MVLLATIAWRNLWRHRRRTLITASAMAVGVALCMSMIAWSDGMYGTMRRVMVDEALGHVQVHNQAWPNSQEMFDTLPQAAERLAAVQVLPTARAASARLYGFGLVGGETGSSGGRLAGVLPAAESQMNRNHDSLKDGRWLPEQGGSNQVVLGFGLAEKLDLGVGGELVVMTQAADGSMGNDLYEVVGIASTADSAMDSLGVWMHLHDLQTLLLLEDQAHEITVLGTDPEAIVPLQAAVQDAIADDEASVRTWWEVSPTAQEMMGMQDVGAVIMLSVVFSVAALGVLNTMLMSVFERTRELGVMGALGVKPWQLIVIVVFESTFLSLIACVLGGALGGLLDWYLIAVGIDFSASVGEAGIESMGVRFDPIMKGAFRLGPVIATLGSVILVGIVSSLWPAIRAARLDPVNAMRQD